MRGEQERPIVGIFVTMNSSETMVTYLQFIDFTDHAIIKFLSYTFFLPLFIYLFFVTLTLECLVLFLHQIATVTSSSAHNVAHRQKIIKIKILIPNLYRIVNRSLAIVN